MAAIKDSRIQVTTELDAELNLIDGTLLRIEDLTISRVHACMHK